MTSFFPVNQVLLLLWLQTKLRLTNEANTKVKELNGILEAIQDEETSFQRDVKAIQHDTNMIMEKNKQRYIFSMRSDSLDCLFDCILFVELRT